MRPKQISSHLAKVVDAGPGEWDEDSWEMNMHPIHLWGPPGVGKSAVIHQVAREEEIGFLDTRASQHDPTDFRGIPAVLNEQAVWLPPQDIPYIGNENLPEKGIWLLDELTSAPPLVQAVLYQATLDHQIGEHKLKPGWTIIAAGNRVEDRAVVYPMSTALANRFSHIEYEVNLDDWTAWALDNGVDTNIVAFLQWKPELLFSFNPESSEKAFCSPRSWEFASNTIRIATKTTLIELLEGTIGYGATGEFAAFLKVQEELPPLDNILVKGEDFDPKRMDLRYALVSALVAKATPKQFERLLQYSYAIPAEFRVLLAMMLAGKDSKNLAACPSWAKWAKDHSDVLIKKRR